MKSQKMKTKTTNRMARKINKRSSITSKGAALVHPKRPILKHFRLIEKKHTFKLIHFRHTSHLALMLILAIIGFFLFASGGMVSSITNGGSVSIGVIVPGPPPSVGAVITSPLDGYSIKDENVIEISGTCQPETFVVVKDNDQLVGSAACTTAGIFVMNIQLYTGKNVLSAINYDNINQAGPLTPTVTVNVTKTNPIVPETFIPVLPSNPSVIPGLTPNTSNECSTYDPGKLPTGGELHISVVCVPRLFMPEIDQVIGLIVWGGEPPYALSINFSQDKDDIKLISLSKPGYITQTFHYEFPGAYKIDFKLTDKKGGTAVVQTAVQVNGSPTTGSGSFSTPGNPLNKIANEIAKSNILNTPVPFYLLAVAITLGFWGGDIFDRKWGAGRLRSKRSA